MPGFLPQSPGENRKVSENRSQVSFGETFVLNMQQVIWLYTEVLLHSREVNIVTIEVVCYHRTSVSVLRSKCTTQNTDEALLQGFRNDIQFKRILEFVT